MSNPILGRAILLDLDGTLADTLDDITASVDHVRGLAGLDALGRTAVRRMIGSGARVLLEQALADNPAGLTSADLWDAWRAHHATQCTATVTLYDGVAERLAQWHAEDRKLAVVTNKPVEFAVRITTHLGIDRFLPVVVGGDSTPAKKPSPEPLLEALRQLDAERHEATMVGDSLPDLRAGKAAGVRTVAVLYGFRDEAELRAEGADAYWTRFGGVDEEPRPND